jgi:cytochrome P450
MRKWNKKNIGWRVMENVLTVKDDRYEALFDVGREAASMGNAADFDTNGAMNALREQGPVLAGSLRALLGIQGRSQYRTELPTYTALSFRACETAFRENESFTSYAYNDMPGISSIGPIVLNKVGLEHQRFRATGQSMFIKPVAMNWWRPNWIDETVDALLTHIATLERADLNIELCARLPLHVVSRGVGLRGEDALVFREHLLESLGNHRAGPEGQRASASVVQQMLREVIAARRSAPGEDVVSGLLAADFETPEGVRKLDDTEVMGFSQHLLLAGGGTTWRQLGIAIHALLTNYPFWEACRDDRALVPAAMEEAVRWNATGPVFPRLVLEDTELEGVIIPANSRVDVCLGAGNRDPVRWNDPDEFDIFRKRQAHLGFGFGPHLCLGQHVARQIMSVAVNGLLDRFPHMRLDPAAPLQRLTGGLEQRGMSAIPVLLQ